jgi:hypothetical protein
VKRISRIFLNVATAVSLALCVATLVLWGAMAQRASTWFDIDDVRTIVVDREGVALVRVWRGGSGSVERQFSAPYPLLLLTLGMMPILWCGHRLSGRRRQRLRPGLCLACGYDLRATPARCPECGAKTSEAAP